MAQASVQLVAEQLQLAGVLDYRIGAALRKQGQALIQSSPAQALVIDCEGVEKSSSVGLSLLLGFMRDAEAAGKAVQVRSLPHDMKQIAQVTGMTEFFPQG
jgi:phospholipid transport system transporter-binding protein